MAPQFPIWGKCEILNKKWVKLICWERGKSIWLMQVIEPQSKGVSSNSLEQPASDS